MVDLKNYGYTPLEEIPAGLMPGRVTELRRECFTVMTRLGEVKAVLKGTFYHNAETSVDFPCVGDFVLSYLIDKRARSKSIAMWSKQQKKNGGWKK